MKRLTTTIAPLVAAAVAAPAANASSHPLLVMQDDVHILSAPAATVADMAGYGTDVVKIKLYWDEVERARGPFTGSSSDGPVTPGAAAGPQPYLTIGSHAPKWATRRGGRA